MINFTSFTSNKYTYDQLTNEIYEGWIEDENDKTVNFYSFLDNRYNKNESSDEKCLIINITNNCNMRCNYCAFSGKYKYERLHNDKTINIDTAKKAINICLNNGITSINFYGGEPTLQFNLIKNIVNSYNLKYSINTNFLSINDEEINFFIKNNFLLLISLDGLKEIHDKNRKDINGSGTFDRIYSNLNKLYTTDRVYYKKNVIFLATLSYPYSIDEINNLFKSDTKFMQPWTISRVMPFDNQFCFDYDLFTFKEYVSGINNLAMEYIDAIKKGKGNTTLGHWVFGRLLKKIYFRDMEVNNQCYINSCCIPGYNKIFLDCDGNFWPCERSQNFMNLGSVKNGIFYDNIKYYVTEYKNDCQKKCADCEFVRFCELCYVSAKENDKMNFNKKHYNCEFIRKKFLFTLSLYTSIMEINENLLMYLENYFD